MLAPMPAAHGQDLYSVDTLIDAVDSNPGDGLCATATGDCSLRAAVQEANALAGEQEVSVGAGVFNLTLEGAGEDLAATGDLDITDDVTISGALFEKTVVNGLGQDRAFHIRGPGSALVTLENLTISGGGGVAQGGAILAAGDLDVADLTIDGNTATAQGGGIFIASGDTAMESSTLSDNAVETAGGAGGAIAVEGNLLVENSTLVNNSSSGSGGALNVTGTASVINATLHGNTAVTGSALSVANTGDLTIAESIVSGTDACIAQAGTTFAHEGNNLEHPGTTCGFTGAGDVHSDPQLGALSDNGGFTETLALNEGSPAIDAGANTSCAFQDQRGLERPADGDEDGSAVCDLGAYEYVAEIFESALSIKFADSSDTFKGGVDASESDGSAAFAPRQSIRPTICERNRTVELFKVKDGNDKKVGRDETNEDGRWSLKKDDPQGVFYAVVIEEELEADDGTIVVCEEANSKSLRPPRQ